MRRQTLICSLLILVLSFVSAADTLIVAGHLQQLSQPLIVEKNEVLAPVVPALYLLGAKTSSQSSTLKITTTGHPTLLFTAGSASFTINGKQTALNAAPRKIGDELYLPVMALAPFLGATAEFDSSSRKLTINPLLDVSYESRQDGIAIFVRSSAALQFTSGRSNNPPRIYFDFPNASLGMGERRIPVAAGQVEQLRLSQYSQTPATVRLVIDCLNPAASTPSVTEEGRLVTIVIGKAIGKPSAANQPPMVKIPLDPVKLIDAKLTMLSEKQSELNIATEGFVQVDCAYDKTAKQLTVTFQNGLNAFNASQLREQHDSLVSNIQSSGEADKPGAKLVISLTRDGGYLVSQEPRNVRVLMGKFDISNMTIVLDAGHGGYDSGAVGVSGTKEKDINLDVILRAGKLLEDEQAHVLYTRSDDTFIPLNDRPALSNQTAADLFVSVHCNSMPRPNSASGTQTYYHSMQSSDLASIMHKTLVNGLGLKDGGKHTARFLVLRENNVPAALLELAFINNTREEALLNSPEFRQKAAEAIVEGIRQYTMMNEWQITRIEPFAVPENPENFIPAP